MDSVVDVEGSESVEDAKVLLALTTALLSMPMMILLQSSSLPPKFTSERLEQFEREQASRRDGDNERPRKSFRRYNIKQLFALSFGQLF